MKNTKRSFPEYWWVILFFVIASSFLVWFIYERYPLETVEQIKEFGVIVGLGLTALGTICSIIISSITLSKQTKSAADLERLKRTLDARALAFEKVFTAAHLCYRQLQQLEKGLFDKSKFNDCQQDLYAAEALSANLDADSRLTIENVVQIIFNIIDAAEKIPDNDSNKAEKYKKLWEENVTAFGNSMTRLREKSPFSDL